VAGGREGREQNRRAVELLEVDSTILIENLFVAPDAAPWFLEFVGDVAAKYGITAAVKQSSGSPIF
jgi:hypothetical protein